MRDKLDKRVRAPLFQARLAQALAEAGLSQAALARDIGVDRSTVSQLLTGADPRLPNGHVVAEAAAALGVSADWLLGLSDRREPAAQVLAAALDMPEAPRALVDDVMRGWHTEARGYKIRHVPATLPDILKTPELIRWEYQTTLERAPEAVISSTEERLALLRDSRSDYEIAMPLTEIASFVRCEGYYNGLPPQVRDAQIDWLLDLHAQLYPTIRVFLFDKRSVFSAPITVFGPLLGVVYLGRHYMVFRDTERVQALAGQFDWLVRAAQVSAHEWPQHLRTLRQDLGRQGGCKPGASG